MRTRLLLLMAATVAIGAAAGCNSPGVARTNAAPAPTVTVTVAPPGAGTPPAHPAPPTATTHPASPPPPAGPRPCTATNLAVSQLPGDSGAGLQDAVEFAVVDTGSATCTLHGYPTFTLTAPSASMHTDVDVTPALQHEPSFAAPFGGSPATLSLKPGERAGFALLFSIVDSGGSSNCDKPTKLHLRMPGSSHTAVGPANTVLACGEPMIVSPYLPDSKLGF